MSGRDTTPYYTALQRKIALFVLHSLCHKYDTLCLIWLGAQTAKTSILPPFVPCDFRLGGGLFGDTYLAVWNDRNVAVKRITIGVHQNQLNEETFKWIHDEATFLRYLPILLIRTTSVKQPLEGV